MSSPILVALDFPTSDEAIRMAKDLHPHVGGFKVGLELMMSEGPGVVAAVADLGSPVFADAKLHDIPNTVAAAARGLASHGARWVTVHGSGGSAMVTAAVEGLRHASARARALVVTVLTSLDDEDLTSVGVERSLKDQVVAMARLAATSGAEGVVCSPREVHAVKSAIPDIVAVTPGVRPFGHASDDQARVATPAEAIEAGADYLVIGRPITRADNPIAAAQAINRSLR